MPVPAFFPPIKYLPAIRMDSVPTFTIFELCKIAEIPCLASGAWTQRRVGFVEKDSPDDKAIWATPGYIGDVAMVVPQGLSKKERARWILATLAYSTLFDEVARECVRREAWAKEIEPFPFTTNCLMSQPLPTELIPYAEY